MTNVTRLGVCEHCGRWSWASLGERCRFCGQATVTAHFAAEELEELDVDQLLGSRSATTEDD